MTEYLKALEDLQRCISDGTWPGDDSVSLLASDQAQRGVLAWRSAVDPADLRFSPNLLGPVNEKDILGPDSFVRFMALEPELSQLLRSLAVIECQGCGEAMLRSDRASVLSSLKRSSGFLILSTAIENPELLGLQVAVVMDLLGAHSIVLKGRRISGQPLSELGRKIVEELEAPSFILRTFSLPLTNADEEEILKSNQLAQGLYGEIHFSILDSLTDEIRLSPLDADFYCPKCSKYESDIGDDQLLFQGRPLRQLEDNTVQSLIKILQPIDKQGRCHAKLKLLADSSFADYPLGLPLSALSTGELLKLLIARFMVTAGGDLKLDLTLIPGLLSPDETLLLKSKFPKLEIVATNNRLIWSPPSSGAPFTVGPYEARPFIFSDIQLTKRSLNVLELEGDGLLDFICSDPKLKREFSRIKYLREGDYSRSETVLEAVGMSKPVAKLLAGTYEARMAGVGERDLNLSSSKKLCVRCLGEGIASNFDCELCGGEILKISDADIRFQGISLADILKLKIKEVEPGLSGVRDLKPYFDWLQRFDLLELSLGDRLEKLSISKREALPLVGFLAELPDSPALVVMKNPSRALSLKESEVLSDAFKKLLVRGHTVVISDSSGRFYEIAGTVIRLRSEFKDSRNRLVKEAR